jgi:UDP-N-acetyl-D-mannosaminuronic acid dehydrogenase
MTFSTVCVLGLGYIGLPTASTFAAHGLHVTGVDVNPRVVDTLSNGGLHIQEPGLRELVERAFQSGGLQIARKPVPADAFIIAVPTPIHEDKTADVSYVIAAAESIVPVLRAGNLVILESTSPPRTTDDVVRPILEHSGLKAGTDFLLAYSPERVLPGQILRELEENARVIGGINRESSEAGRELYSVFVRGEIVLTDAVTAETVKLMENTYRDANIALSNELSRLAEKIGVDIWEAIAIANRHPRVKLLQPGPGVGGHCISVDPWFLVEANPEGTAFIRAARLVNDGQPSFVVERTERLMGGLTGKRVAALGLTYKPDVDDVRESPSLEVLRILQERGVQTAAYDPLAPDVTMAGDRASTVEQAVEGADAVLLLVAHRELRSLQPQSLRPRMRSANALDCQNVWHPAEWEAAGFRFHRLGDGRARKDTKRSA